MPERRKDWLTQAERDLERCKKERFINLAVKKGVSLE